MASSKQKEGATTLREKSSSSSTVSSTGRSPSSRSSLLTSPNRRPEKPTVPSRGLTAVTASTGAVAKPPSTRRPTERNAPAATTALKERAAVLKAPPSSSKAAASHKHLTEKPSASASSKSRTSHTSSVPVRGRSPGAVVKRKEAKNGSLSRTSSDPGLLEFAALSLLGNNKIEASTETTASISSMEDHLPNELLPDPVDAKAAEYIYAPPPPPPPHECNKQQHEQSPLESEGVAHDDGSRSINEEMIKEDNIEIEHNATLLEDPKGGEGDEVGNYEEEKLMVEVMKKNAETMHGGKKEAVKSNDVIEEARSKLLERKKSKVKALVGAFETVMSLHGSEVQTDQTQEKGGGEMD